MGFAYNLGRIVSAAAPYTIGKIVQERGFTLGLSLTAGGFLLAGIIAFGLRPEWGMEPVPEVDCLILHP